MSHDPVRSHPAEPGAPPPATPPDGGTYFQAAFEHAAIGMALLDPAGRWLQVNRSFCRIVGRSAAELRRVTFQAITHPDDLAADLACLDRLLAGAIPSYTLEKRYLRRDGRAVWVLLTVALVRDGAGAPLHIIAQVQDIDERKRAEAARQASEARFRAMFEQAAVGMCQVAPDGRLLQVNRRLCEMLGYTEAELLGRTAFDVTHPADRVESARQIGRLLAGEIPRDTREKRLVRRDGEVVWVELARAAVHAPGGAIESLITVLTDVTERKRAEAALQASQARYERIAANIPGMVYQYVYRPDGSGGYTFVSEGARTLFGVAPEAALRDARVLLDLIHPDDRAGFLALARAVAATLGPFRWEGRVVLPSGEERFVQIAARDHRQPDGSVVSDGLVMDATELRRAAQRLEESEQRLRSLVDHNVDAVVSVDLESRILGVNPAFTAITGYPAEELLGQSMVPLILPDHLADARRHFQRAMAGTPQTYEVALRHRSGRRVDIVATDVPIVVDGRVVGVFGIHKDVTEQRQLQEQLRQAQKLEAVGRLAGGIAHDFNNLLTAILSNAELVLGELADGPVRQDVAVIRETAERAAALTRQLLAFSRKQVIEPRPIDFNAIVRETRRMLGRTLGEGISVEPDLGEVGSVLADPGQVEQVLVNLVVNARDAMPAGGAVTIRTRDALVGEAEARRHKGLRPGAYVTLAVADTGVGMDPATQARVFEPFFTTKPVGHGTGLGLATVYGIVKQYGGYTAVESAPGVGTTFTVYLPRHAGALAAPEPPRSAPPTGTETVLVVEDETAVRSSIRRILARQGYTVLEARHGADALRVLDAAAVPVDLVLTDLMMPEMGGRELIAELRARHPALPILALSGYDEGAVLRGEALPAGTRFLEKPFTVDGLLRCVRDVLDAGRPAAPAGGPSAATPSSAPTPPAP